MAGLFGRGDELERRLRRERPVPRAELTSALLRSIDSGSPQRRSSRAFRFVLAAAVTSAMVGSLGAFGGFSYAASSVNAAARTVVRAVTPAKQATHTVDFNSATAQYGNKVSICAVQPNGKQHTISISSKAKAAYLATHPNAYEGSCGALRPRGAKANVCLRLATGKFVPVYVPAGKVNAYLRRNFKAHTTKTGKC